MQRTGVRYAVLVQHLLSLRKGFRQACRTEVGAGEAGWVIFQGGPMILSQGFMMTAAGVLGEQQWSCCWSCYTLYM